MTRVRILRAAGADLGAPALSVVVVSPARFANIRTTVRHLQRQTIRDRLQLVLVAPTTTAIDDHAPHELDGFHDVLLVACGPVADVDRSAAWGLLEAAAPVCGVIEDHAFPEDGWASASLAAHDGPWVAVGSTMVNANPVTGLSWANLLLAYGAWTAPTTDGERDALPGHNLTYKTAPVAAFGAGLAERLGRGGRLLRELRGAGGRLYLAEAARVHHLNPSTLRATATVRFHSGRLYGAMRAHDGGWGWARRALYVLGAPLIPFVRYARLPRGTFAPRRGIRRPVRTRLAVCIALACDAAGQLVGYLRGEGASRAILCAFELDRLPHLTAADRRRAGHAPADGGVARAPATHAVPAS
ncbi:MAG: hypothetical protein MUF21_01550 [Gemmatimonadaceae bacterium]|jgi:hypothetical protein|nr:hypothetical protein [Gemmatimonadaceae bacterium]